MMYFNILIWDYTFYKPAWLWLLLLVPVVIILWEILLRRNYGQLKFTGTESTQQQLVVRSVRIYRLIVIVCYSLALSCTLVTLAEPYNANFDPPKIDYKNGIDIILAIDASGSMLAQDFSPNRLEVAKSLAQKFIDSRKGDRIGLVVYEGEAYTAVPATLDYSLLKEQVGQIEPGLVESGTAIGNGLGVAVTRLRSDQLKSKVIILLTDGSNNAGSIAPLDAAKLAKEKKCKVYTIGVGSRGMAPTPVQTPFGIVYEQMPVEIDEPTLQAIAEETGGTYFRATNEWGLDQIYAEINQLEKRKMEFNQLGKQPPVTLFPFFLWTLIFSLTGFAFQRIKFRLDD
jgi:Ca-activated chloride channel family protein